MRRPAIALLVVLGPLALPAAASAQATLTPTQFAAIDEIYVTFAAFEDGATTAERVRARAACTALGSADALLLAVRRACYPQLRIGQALGQSQRCTGRRSCLLAARAVQRAATHYLARARASNRVVEELGLAPACSRELRRGAARLTCASSPACAAPTRSSSVRCACDQPGSPSARSAASRRSGIPTGVPRPSNARTTSPVASRPAEADPRSVVEQEGRSRASPGGDATALRGDDRRRRCAPVERSS